MSKALSGIRVVEQGTFITGPCCGMMLADLGADVIKIESPGGDPYRSYQGGQYSPHFQAYNRNKRSLMLDMKQGTDRDDLRRAWCAKRMSISRTSAPAPPNVSGREPIACSNSTRAWCVARSAASARAVLMWIVRAMTRWPRP